MFFSFRFSPVDYPFRSKMASKDKSEPNLYPDREVLGSSLAKDKPTLKWLSKVSADALAVLNPDIVASIQQAFESSVPTPEMIPNRFVS